MTSAVFGKESAEYVEVVVVKANRLDGDAWHTPQQRSQCQFEVRGHARIQDPTAVLAHPDEVILKAVDSVTGDLVLHSQSIPPSGSFTPG